MSYQPGQPLQIPSVDSASQRGANIVRWAQGEFLKIAQTQDAAYTGTLDVLMVGSPDPVIDAVPKRLTFDGGLLVSITDPP